MILKGGDSGTEKKATSGNLIKVIQDVSRARSLPQSFEASNRRNNVDDPYT